MAKKHIVVIFSFCLLLIISACKQGDKQTGAPKSPFIGGTSGLVINFEKDAPPPEVTDGGSFPFNVIVRLVNEGETQVAKDNVVVKISGFEPRVFGTTQESIANQQPKSDLAAKTRDPDGKIIDGGTGFVTIPPSTGNKETDFLKAGTLAGNTPFTFRADVCYKYQTRGNAKLCILKDLINVDKDDFCNPNGARQIFNSGSPVQFSNLRQSVAGTEQITFSFDIAHSGNGNIYEDSKETVANKQAPSCPRDDIRELRAKQDRVKINVDVGQDLQPGLSCNNIEEGGYVRLISGKRTIICNLALQGKHNTDFEAILNTVADFNYDDNKETQVLVKHLPVVS
jgi:hypothetical protein